MLYLDANIFVFGILNTPILGTKAISLLQKIQRGEELAMTSALTIDEIFWVVKRNRNTEAALEGCNAILNFPNLEIIDATKETATAALEIIKACRLNPRDAFHAATAISEKADFIVSTDKHFDRVKELRIQTL